MYKKPYLSLFNEITDIINRGGENAEEIINRLCLAQCNAEELFLDLCEQHFSDNSDLEQL